MKLLTRRQKLSANERYIYMEWKEMFNSFINSRIAKLFDEYSMENNTSYIKKLNNH